MRIVRLLGLLTPLGVLIGYAAAVSAGPLDYECCASCTDGTASDLSSGVGPWGPDDEELCQFVAHDFCLSSFVGEYKFGPAPQVCEPLPPTEPCTWPVVEIVTLGKGQSASNNAKVVSAIRGNVVSPASLGETAHRIRVCAGTRVEVTVTDSTGSPTITAASGEIICGGGACIVETIDEKAKYVARSSDGKDTDRITLLPE
jgi:hypothetical protein